MLSVSMHLLRTGSLVFSVPATLIKENHSTFSAFFMARAEEHALTVCLDKWHTTANGKIMPSRNRGWQTILALVNENSHSWVGSHQLATQTEEFLWIAFCCNQG